MFFSQIGSLIKYVQIRPAAKKPLYSPWLAAKPFVGLNKCSGKLLKVLLPIVSQANISKYIKYKCSSAIMAIRIWDVVFICGWVGKSFGDNQLCEFIAVFLP